jgi:hypothetical protein
MKKSLYSILALMAMLIAFTSCEKDEIENTATVDMAGEWYVHVSLVAPNGEELDPDWFGDGYYNITTSNTAANIATEMWLVDPTCYYFPYQVKINADPSTMTFSSASNSENLYGPSAYLYKNYEMIAGETVTVTDGKIVKGGAKTQSGMPADYIEFYISFSDDPFIIDPDLPAGCKIKVSGHRYTGFVNDEM